MTPPLFGCGNKKNDVILDRYGACTRKRRFFDGYKKALHRGGSCGSSFTVWSGRRTLFFVQRLRWGSDRLTRRQTPRLAR